MSNARNKPFMQGKECFSRMNFLFQASQLMAGRNDVLSAYYGQLCRSIGKKAVLRSDPVVKRGLCKRCSLAQQPGLTADLSVVTPKRRKSKKPPHNVDADAQLRLTCRKCGRCRNFCVNSDYGFWLENPDSVVEVTTLALGTTTIPATTSVDAGVAGNAKKRRFKRKKSKQLELKNVVADVPKIESMET